jgi:hypothetical protein
MSYARDFILMAKADPRVTDQQPRVVCDGQQTIMKLCGQCLMQMPHVVGAQFCVLCEMDGLEETRMNEEG